MKEMTHVNLIIDSYIYIYIYIYIPYTIYIGVVMQAGLDRLGPTHIWPAQCGPTCTALHLQCELKCLACPT